MCKVKLEKPTPVYACDSDGVLYLHESLLPEGAIIDVDRFSNSMRVMGSTPEDIRELAVHGFRINGEYRGHRLLSEDIEHLIPPIPE